MLEQLKASGEAPEWLSPESYDCLIYGIIYKEKIVYVGQTKIGLDNRIRNYKRAIKDLKKKTYVINFLRKHFDEIKFIILKLSDKNTINSDEISLISQYNTLYPNGLNLTLGGESPVFSKETRNKMSNSRKGKVPWNKGTTGLMPTSWSKGKKLKPHSEETKMKRKRFGSQNHFFGKKHTEETRAKISKNRKGIPAWNKGTAKPKNTTSWGSKEHRLKMRLKQMGRTLSEETKAKIKLAKRNPVYGYINSVLVYEFDTFKSARDNGYRINPRLLNKNKPNRAGICWFTEKK